MLSDLMFLSGLVAFIVVIVWALTTDAPGNDGGLTGMLSMKSTDDYIRIIHGRMLR